MPRRRRVQEIRRHQSEISYQTALESHERSIQNIQTQCFKGAAVIRLEDISTGHDWWHVTSDGENTSRISRILELQGCLRLGKQYHIPVLVQSRDWQRTVFYEEKTLMPDLDLPQIGTRNNYSLAAIDHRSLVIAAKEKFRRLGWSDPWWVVDIFVVEDGHESSARDELRRILQENFSNDCRPSDGRIYRNIQYYQRSQNRIAEDYWWAVLEAEPGSRKGDYLWSLPENLKNAFDSLLPISGIWPGMNLGVLHKLRAMKCDEPLICYLNHIRQTFLSLTENNTQLLYSIDAMTVKLIQSRAPKVSHEDMLFLERQWSKQTLFRFMDQQARSRAFERLKEIDFLIPTLETFFQDILLLDVGRTVMKKLCLAAPTKDETIDGTLRSQYIGYPSSELLTREFWDNTVVCGCLYDLWRFSFQYAFELTNNREHRRRVPRKQKDKHRAAEFGLDEWHDENSLAALNNFIFLATQHKFQVPFGDMTLPPMQLPAVSPCDFPPNVEEEVDIERRAGKPFTDSINADRFALSRGELEPSRVENRVGAGFVRRCVFRAFFSYLNPVIFGDPTGESMDGNHMAGWPLEDLNLQIPLSLDGSSQSLWGVSDDSRPLPLLLAT